MTQNQTSEKPVAPSSNRNRIVLGALAVAAAVGIAGVYGMGGMKRNDQAGSAVTSCAKTVDLAKKIAPLVKGEVAALTVNATPFKVPDLAFEDANGKARKLSEWQGKTVLVNLWATWCVPCRKEMPALEALQTKLGGPKFEVVAINIDTTNPDKPKAFYKDTNLVKLGYYTDAKAKAFQDLKSVGRALGMPTTVLMDGNGCEIGFMAGPAEWAGDDAIKLITAATGS